MYIIKDTWTEEFLGICETTDIRTGLRALKLIGAPNLDNIWKTDSLDYAKQKKEEMESYFGWKEGELEIMEAELVIRPCKEE